MVDKLTRLAEAGFTRRGFLAGAGAASAATLIGCGNSAPPVAPTAPVAPTPTPLTDADVLNFALNLEYLEADFYMRAATGSGIPDADRLGGPVATAASGTQVKFLAPFFQQIANELAQTELQHVRAIQATIKAAGGTPVAMPQIDYTAGFNGLATAAKIPLNPFADTFSFILGALTFEDVGVTAYTGAASLIKDKGILSAAAGIQAAESYHAGTLRTILVGNAITNPPGPKDPDYISYYAAIQGVRASLGGGAETTLTAGGVQDKTTGFYSPSSIVAADATNSLAFARTTDQVLHIVYEQAGGVFSSGGFFPNGVNGTIKTTAS